MKRLSTAFATIALSSSVMLNSSDVLAWNCDEERMITKDFDIGSVENIDVEAGAGRLDIKGVGEGGKIGITAKLCSSDKDLLAEMDVKTKIDDDVAMLKTYFPKKSWGNYSAAIDLVLTVPTGSSLEVADSSGDLEIKDVQNLVLTDSSGDLSLKNIGGKVTLTDSSGSISMKEIGSAEVTDSSGDMIVKKVTGDFTVNVDSSGDIDVRGVGGNVLVKVDSSGSIDVQDVSGDFVVEKDGSGNIDYDGIQGDVSIPARKRK